LIGVWIQYATWEEKMKEFERARSIFERALEIDHRNSALWIRYADFEIRNKFVNHARNVYDRAVTLLPRVDQFWYKYSYMEEMIGNVDGARQIFERWMKWEPGVQGWSSYVKFEERQQEEGRARGIFERFLECNPNVQSYLKFARWEEARENPSNARSVYERAMEELPPEEKVAKLYLSFAKFEESQSEFERCRIIFKFALEELGGGGVKGEDEEEEEQNLEKKSAIQKERASIQEGMVAFERKFGRRVEIESIVRDRRREEYEKRLGQNEYDYDTWFDLISLEEELGDEMSIREAYERSIANIPQVEEKRYWRRYIYLWIKYALFEELVMKDISRVREIYQTCLSLIPHKQFTFGKIWIHFAKFEIRQDDLMAARKVLGQAIGLTQKTNVFKEYISLETKMGEVDRVRTLYTKFLEANCERAETWIDYGNMEASLQEADRARQIFELGINQPTVDAPELLWKSFIDFEISQNEGDKARLLFERLLERTQHVKVWISFGQFEGNEICGGGIEIARDVFERGYQALRMGENGLKEERVMLLEAWKKVEKKWVKKQKLDLNSSQAKELLVAKEGFALIDQKWPKKIRKRRLIDSSAEKKRWEEYYDYHFPDERREEEIEEGGGSGMTGSLKILEMAKQWKTKQKRERDEEDEEEEDSLKKARK